MYELGDVEPVCTDLNLLGGMCRGKFSLVYLVGVYSHLIFRTLFRKRL